MALFPVLINRSIKVDSFKKNKELVSITFIAKFSDGSEKFLNQKRWQYLGLLKASDLINQIVPSTECCLYYRDWSSNPIFGTIEENYPIATNSTFN